MTQMFVCLLICLFFLLALFNLCLWPLIVSHLKPNNEFGSFCSHILQGVIAENPVAHPERFITEHIEKVLERASPSWFMPICRFFIFLAKNAFLWRIGIFWTRSTSCASHAVKSLTGEQRKESRFRILLTKNAVPILVMHGTADEIVPISHGMEIYDNAPHSLRHLWISEGAWHW